MGHGVGSGQETVDSLLAELTHFRGGDREQEDDIIPLTLERSKPGMTDRESTLRPGATGHNSNRRTLAEFTLPSEPGNERLAMEKVAGAIEELRPSEQRLERLKTAVGGGDDERHGARQQVQIRGACRGAGRSRGSGPHGAHHR